MIMSFITAYLKKAGVTLLAAVLVGCALSSCDNAIYDDEGDCSVTYRVAFRYDRNLKWADAFGQEVKSVHLYAFGKDGTLVWHRSEKGAALAAQGYAMTVDLPAGDYRLVAWCGLENDGGGEESFSVPDVRAGETRPEALQCTLRRGHDTPGGAYSDKRLHPLFHGMLDVSLPDLSDVGGEHTDTIPLTKDTNHVRIILQHLSGLEVDPGDFTFRIEEENGLMAYDNSLQPDEMITYRAYEQRSGTASMEIDDYEDYRGADTPRQTAGGTVTAINVAIADLSIARLTTGRKTYLTIETANGDIAARIPLTDYALLLKDSYDHPMTDQEYLDREDEYALTFFLDERDKWIGTSIIINSWKLVLDDIDFK